MKPAIRGVIITVPVHNEEALLRRCLSSLTRAVAASPVQCEVRVVLDACTDGSAKIAAEFPFDVIEVELTQIGATRSRGIASGLERLSQLPLGEVWIANTDADSAVPSNWIGAQIEAAARGVDVVVGTVRPDFDDLTPAHQQLWLDTHLPGEPNGHTHGANLGLRASTYVEAGGFPALAEHEDVRLVEACRKLGAVVLASDAAEVITSGRFVGRTAGGYAAYLRRQDLLLQGERSILLS